MSPRQLQILAYLGAASAPIPTWEVARAIRAPFVPARQTLWLLAQRGLVTPIDHSPPVYGQIDWRWQLSWRAERAGWRQ